MHIRMLIKSQSEVRLHTGHSVHFHPSRCARPSFSIFRWSGSETRLIAPAYYLALSPLFSFRSLAVYKNEEGRLGIVYDMNNHSVYLGRQSDWYHFLCFFDAYNNNSVKWSGGWRYSNSAHCMHKPKLWFTCLWLLHHECYSIAIKS